MDSFSVSAMVYPELKTTLCLDYCGSNFQIWNMKLRIVLSDNLVNYVLTEPKPREPTDSTPQNDVVRYQKWVSDDYTARNIILGSLHENLYYCFHHQETAESLMDALTDFFFKPSMSRRMAKLNRYVGRRMSEGKPINDHVLEMEGLAIDLDLDEGLKIPEELQAVMLMNSLPDSWDDNLTSTIMRIDKEGLDLVNVRNRVRDLGILKEIYQRRDEEAASASSKMKKKKFKGNCYSCGKYGHCRADCPDFD